MTCEKMIKKNLKDLRKGRTMRYTKEAHSKAGGFNTVQARWWNRELPNAEQYTKEEHSKALGFNSWGARMWNWLLPNAEQYTEDELRSLYL